MKPLSQHIHESFVNESIASDQLINQVKTVSTKFEVFHHNTPSFAQHKGFDDIQTSFNGYKDDLIEKLIGYTGDRYQSTSIPEIVYDDSIGTTLVLDLYSLGQSLIDYSKSTGQVDIENIGQEFHGLGAKLNYLLTLK